MTIYTDDFTIPIRWERPLWQGVPPVYSTAVVAISLNAPDDYFNWGAGLPPIGYWRAEVVIRSAPKPDNTNTWYGPFGSWRQDRLRSDNGQWVPPDSGSSGLGPRIWQPTPIMGQYSGAFRFEFSSDTSDGPPEWVQHTEIWARDVLLIPDGTTVDLHAKPMAMAKGALQTIVDGGGP